jgi:hypothetical protein
MPDDRSHVFDDRGIDATVGKRENNGETAH